DLILSQAPVTLLFSSSKDQLPSPSRPSSHPMMRAGIASGAIRRRPGAVMSPASASIPVLRAGLIFCSQRLEKSKSIEKDERSSPPSPMPSHSLILSAIQVAMRKATETGFHSLMNPISLSQDSWSQGLI